MSLYSYVHFAHHHLVLNFLKNPFIVDENNIQAISDLFNAKRMQLEFDITLIKEEMQLPNEMSDALWKRLITNCDFMVLKDIVPKFLCMFGSTYVCESTFSSLARRKDKFRNALSQENLESEIRCELCKSKPNFDKLA